MNIDDIKLKLQKELEYSRYLHSLNVIEMAASLAEKYGVDVKKAELAGILHDCGKNFGGEKAREYAREIGYTPDEIELAQPRLLHGIIGEHIAKTEYNVDDEEVLSAIRWHTTGKAGMTDLEKIIYVADYIEPLRDFEGIEEMRKAAFQNLDECVVLCADSTIRFILKKGLLLHEKTIETRNHSLKILRNLR